MLILNFTHPLTDEHKTQIEALAGASIAEIRTIAVQVDQNQSLSEQISALVELRNSPRRSGKPARYSSIRPDTRPLPLFF
jgi:hypothetical protein